METFSFWSALVLAAVLAADICMSLRPLPFIRTCLEGVGFPEDWWWSLLVVKATAVGGLIAGIWEPGIRAAAAIGVVVYFVCAALAHVRARFTGTEFWLNCLGMLVLSVVPAGTATAVLTPA